MLLIQSWAHIVAISATLKLPTSPPPKTPNTVDSDVCGTDSTAFMCGRHPTPEEGIVQRKVCFEWEQICEWNVIIDVAACKSQDDSLFYVYNLKQTPNCELAYCGIDM